MKFQPGQSGNPGGRPKRREAIDAMVAELKRKPFGQAKTTNAQLLARTAVGQAIAGDVAWAKLVMEYVYGKPPQPIDIEVNAYIQQVAAIIGADPAEITTIAERRKALTA